MCVLLLASDVGNVTIGLSSAALLLSVYGVWEKRRDGRRQMKLRLSKIVEQVGSLDLEQAEAEQKGDRLPLGRRVQYNARREMLVREGVDLINSLPPSYVTDGAYRMLAVALNRVGDSATATGYYEKAVAAAPSNSVFRIFALRALATNLFRQGAVERGRGVYREALALIGSEATDDKLWLAGSTYTYWGASEALFDNDAALKLWDEGETWFGRIKNPVGRSDGIRSVAEARDTGFGPRAIVKE